MNKNKKNVSKKIKNGTTLQTRDEYVGESNYIKPSYKNNKSLYRKVVVVDSNRDDDLAIVVLTTKGKHKLRNYKSGKSSYKPFVETMSHNQPIRNDSKKFVANKIQHSLSKEDTSMIRKHVFSGTKQAGINRQKVRKLKNRKKGTI